MGSSPAAEARLRSCCKACSPQARLAKWCYINISLYIYIFLYIYIYFFICRFIFISIFLYLYIPAYIHVLIYIYMYTYPWLHGWKEPRPQSHLSQVMGVINPHDNIRKTPVIHHQSKASHVSPRGHVRWRDAKSVTESGRKWCWGSPIAARAW